MAHGRITIRNQTRYPDDEVKDLILFALRPLGIHSTFVNISHTRQHEWRKHAKEYCAIPYSGLAHSYIPKNWRNLAPAKAVCAIQLSIATPEFFPMERGTWRWGWEETHRKPWPLFKLGTWQEALVAIAAHEGKHTEYHLEEKRASELACELYSAEALERYRND